MQKAENTDLEKELSTIKGSKALMESDHTEEIKEAYVEVVKPGLSQLRGRFENCMFAKKKIRTHTPLSNEHIVEEMMNVSTKFKLLAKTWKSGKVPMYSRNRMKEEHFNNCLTVVTCTHYK